MKRNDISKYGENRHVLWSYDSRRICIITSKLCVYLYTIEETEDLVILRSSQAINDATSHLSGHDSLIPKVKRVKMVPYKLLHLMKLPPFSTITKICHLTNDTFVIATNHSQFIHVQWKGEVSVEWCLFILAHI